MESNRTRSILIALVVVIALGVVTALWYSRSGTTRQPPTATPAPTATAAPAPTDTPAPAPTDTPAPAEEAAPAATTEQEATPAAEEEAYPAPAAAAAGEPAEEAAYPPPQAASAAEEGAYPPPQAAAVAEEGAYPAPAAVAEQTSRIPIVPFAIERPVDAGSTVIRGAGPAGVPIIIISVTFMGEVLGEGVIDEDGTFEIAVPELEAGNWVGVALADLAGSDFAFEDFYPTGFYGEGAAQVPQVGFVYDSVTVGG